MCVIAIARTGSPLPSFAMFHRMWNSNPDGAGFVYPTIIRGSGKKGIRIVKGLMSFTQFKDAVQQHREHFSDAENKATCDVGFHFRIASAGGKSAALTHPFSAGGDVALMHNGHMHSLSQEDSNLLQRLPGMYSKPEKMPPKVLAVFDAEVPTELEELKQLVESGQMTPGEAEEYARLYIDKAPSQQNSWRRRETDSDTSRLAKVLSALPWGWQRNEMIHAFIKEIFLHSDKVALFDGNGLAKIINEDIGHWIDGCWYSNTYWRPDDKHAGRLVSGEEMIAEETGTRPYSTPSFSQSTGTMVLDEEKNYYRNGRWMTKTEAMVEERRERARLTSDTKGKTDAELRAMSDEMWRKTGPAKQGSLWPASDPCATRAQLRRNTTPRLTHHKPDTPRSEDEAIESDDLPNFWVHGMFRNEEDDTDVQPAD